MGSGFRRHWVKFVAVGLGCIRCGWVEYPPWLSLAVVGLYSPGWAGFVTVGLDSRLGWVFAVVGFHSLSLGWICCHRVGFTVVGLYSPLLGRIRHCWALTHRHLVAFALAALNSPSLAHSLTLVALDSPSLTPLASVGFKPLHSWMQF